MNTGLEQLEDE